MANFNAVKLNLKSYYDTITIQTLNSISPTSVVNLKQDFSNRPQTGQLYPRNNES